MEKRTADFFFVISGRTFKDGRTHIAVCQFSHVGEPPASQFGMRILSDEVGRLSGKIQKAIIDTLQSEGIDSGQMVLEVQSASQPVVKDKDPKKSGS